MRYPINVISIGFALWIVIYTLFGNPDSTIWNSVFYTFDSGFFIAFLFVIRNRVTGVKEWLIDLVISILLLRVMFNIGGLFDPKSYAILNNSKWFMIVIAILIYLCLIVNRKRK